MFKTPRQRKIERLERELETLKAEQYRAEKGVCHFCALFTNDDDYCKKWKRAVPDEAQRDGCSFITEIPF